jgi:ABC-2 type transport system permease protein
LGFNFGYLSHITLSIAVMIGACISAGLSFDVLGFLFFLYMLLGAVLVQAAFLIFSSAFSFFLINQNPIFDIINAFKNFVNYPLHIYPAILQFMLTFVVPVAFINFYPAAAILGKNPGTAFPIEPAAIVPVIGMMLFTLSVMFWNRALKKYQSTGS